MAKLVGLFGKMTGKKGDNVFSVVKGQQIFRQWNPVVANPNTEKQVQVRARMKLMSQLGAVFAPIIAMRRTKGVSPRNKFMSINYPLTNFESDKADIFLKGIQLTQSPKAFPVFQSDRSEPEAILCSIAEANTNDYDAVVYAAVIIGQDGKLRYWDSVMVTEAGANRIFQGKLAYTLESIVIYAYGINYGSAAAAATFSNIEGDAAQHIAELFASRNDSVTSAVMSATNGLTMEENHLKGRSDGGSVNIITLSSDGETLIPELDEYLHGRGHYVEGDTVHLSVDTRALEEKNYRFTGWYGNLALTTLVTGNVNYNFTAQVSLTLYAGVSPIT